MVPFSIIVAMDEKQGIGKAGVLPWHLPGELKYFKEITTATTDPDKQNVVIMGRKTWDSLPEKFRPLPQRINVVVSRNLQLVLPRGVEHALDLIDILTVLQNSSWEQRYESVFVIGGAQLYQEAVKLGACHMLFVTHVLKTFDCDAFFPPFKERFSKKNVSSLHNEKGLQYLFVQYTKETLS